MPKRTDIKTILIVGSGPIVIGQGCEFDYSGTQACKALRAEGYRVVLINSNPATIMTDPEFSDRTYIEPITPEVVRKVLAKQKEIGDPVHALLPTLGGQTALNCACAAHDNGTLKEFGVEMIGADRAVIHRAEDRQAFKDVVQALGLKMPRSKTVTALPEAHEFLAQIGLPAIIRPAFTLGGTGGGIAYNREEFDEIVTRGLRASMIKQVQIDQSVLGWKEFELEVVRDRKDNCIVVCGVENIDPMGVHTGDSITVAPILTLTDKEYQAMRDAAFAIMRAVGVETGGSNVQFAVDPAPKDGKFEMVVVEMNPRVSRSSALASKATGFPIAKVAAKLAVGYTLDELRNDITGTTSACFEPAIDYVVTKMPRWTFEKFPEADETLTTQMKSVGEAMAIGRTFAESFQKAIRSMEVKRFGYGLDRNDRWLVAKRAGGAPAKTADGDDADWPIDAEKLGRKLAVPSQGRIYYIRYAFKQGWTLEQIHAQTRIDPWFLDQMKRLVEFEDELLRFTRLEDVPRETLQRAKQMGYSDAQLAFVYLGAISPDTILKVRAHRKGLSLEPVYKLVDTCAAEFEAATPYYYSTYETGAGGVGSTIPSPEDEVRVTPKPKVIIIGGGPNRIGQGIEFDYCCVHASFAARELGFESVMINSNPETVSTDYDTSDLLFFEPLTLEDVLNVVERLNGKPLGFHFIGKVGQGKRVSDELLRLTEQAHSGYCLGSGVVVGFELLSTERGSRGVLLARSTSGVWGLQHPDERDEEAPPQPWKLPDILVSRLNQSDLEEAERLIENEPKGFVYGLIVQFGGQTPLNLAKGLVKAAAPIIGTSVDSIDLAEDRDRFDALLSKMGLHKPPSGIARSLDDAVAIAARIGFPVLVRPSYVLGGRGMEICPDEKSLRYYMSNAVNISELEGAPVLIDKFLDDATEVDVDVVADFGGDGIEGSRDHGIKVGSDSIPRSQDPTIPGSALVCGVLEHIEQAGIHSGDSACAIPAWSLSAETVERIKTIGRDLARELRVNGLMNVQMAVKREHGEDRVYILEVNPRASRTVPFVGKATHVPWARIAAKVMMGRTLAELGAAEVTQAGSYAVKESVFPFSKFPGVDIILGPEMRSTGEVMGIDALFPIAFAKAQLSADTTLPTAGNVFISVRPADRPKIKDAARALRDMGFGIYATAGTAADLEGWGIRCTVLKKLDSGTRPSVIDHMTDGAIQMVFNTPTKTGLRTDEGRIRAAATRLGIAMFTTTTAANCAAQAIQFLCKGAWDVKAMQDYRADSPAPAAGRMVSAIARKPSAVR